MRTELSSDVKREEPRAREELPSVPLMDVQEIMRFLPHRYPFLLLDRVVGCVPGTRISGYKTVTRHEAYFQQAATNDAAMPDLFVVEAMAQLCLILTFKTLGIDPVGRELMFFAGINNARFQLPVRVGDKLEIEASIVRLMRSRGIGKFAARATVGGGLVASTEMMAALRM